MASEERFGYEWEKYAQLLPSYEGQFRNWTGLVPHDVEGKKVLDAGCGMGRNSYWPLRWGAREVVAFDNDPRTLASAQRTLSAFPNILVERHNLNRLPWRGEFDLVLCIGVLHHVDHPTVALENLVRALRTGGRLIVWVYSYEGNEWIVRFVDPVRLTLTSKLPLPLVHFLSYGASVPLWAFVKVAKGPTPYLRQLSTFTFAQIHSIVFDQLIPRVAHYWTKEEVESLTEGLPLGGVTVMHPANGMGWIVSGYRV